MSKSRSKSEELELSGKLLDKDAAKRLDLKTVMAEMPLTEDTTCGFWIFRGSFWQRFANNTSYVFMYGLSGGLLSMGGTYFNGTITTIEKRYKIPSRNTGIINVAFDISQLFACWFLSYVAGKGSRPKWIGFGVATHIVFCLLNALPHFLHGPGEDALRLTQEYVQNSTVESVGSDLVCRLNSTTSTTCSIDEEEKNLEPQIILFAANFIAGIGGSLFYSLGSTYMDDNTPKEKTPILLSFSYFMRMLGPAIGYTLASYCLRFYIAPELSPLITPDDPRWIGAWWLGWVLIAAIYAVSAFFISMYPKELPETAARKRLEVLQQDRTVEKTDEVPKASFKDMKDTFMRLFRNKTFMANNYAAVFYIFGYMPYWIYAPKYIEIEFRKSASTANFVTGTIGLGFSAVGILLAGVVISKYKPRARQMAMWNVIVGFATVLGMLSYLWIGCPDNEESIVVDFAEGGNSTLCYADCGCDYVPYSPVCGENGLTYISPCHAGCRNETGSKEGKSYFNCSCVSNTSIPTGGQATSGYCPVDCYHQFYTFLAIMCTLKLLGSSARATNFLVAVRCVDEKDKPASIGFDLSMLSLFALIPSPIVFGWLFDQMCLVWGKTCSGEGNCWLYDAEALRFYLNISAATFGTIGTLFDAVVWYYVKDLKIFDEDEEEGVKVKE